MKPTPRATPHPADIGGDAAELHRLFMDLARLAGLLQPDEAGAGHPISLSQAFALHELAFENGLSQRELAERLRLEKSSVSRLAAELQHARTDRADARSGQLSAVPAATDATGP